MKSPRGRSVGARLLLGRRTAVAAAVAVLLVLASGCSVQRDPQIGQERVSELFEDSVASATAVLGERDAEVSSAFEWHTSPYYGCELARYARWRLTDYALGDQVLREIAKLGADADLRIFARDGSEDSFHWLDDNGTATWDDNPDPHFRKVGDTYGGGWSEHHLSAQILLEGAGVRPDDKIAPPFSLSSYAEAAYPVGLGWFEVNVCRRESE